MLCFIIAHVRRYQSSLFLGSVFPSLLLLVVTLCHFLSHVMAKKDVGSTFSKHIAPHLQGWLVGNRCSLAPYIIFWNHSYLILKEDCSGYFRQWGYNRGIRTPRGASSFLQSCHKILQKSLWCIFLKFAPIIKLFYPFHVVSENVLECLSNT